MVAPLIDSSAPSWAQRFALNIQTLFVSRSPKSPIRLASFDSGNLPAAADWLGCIIFVSDKNKVGLSNGTTWTDPAGGAL